MTAPGPKTDPIILSKPQIVEAESIAQVIVEVIRTCDGIPTPSELREAVNTGSMGHPEGWLADREATAWMGDHEHSRDRPTANRILPTGTEPGLRGGKWRLLNGIFEHITQGLKNDLFDLRQNSGLQIPRW